MAEEKKYQKALSGTFFCLGILIYGTMIFKQSSTIDLNTLIYFFKTGFLYSILVGVLGFYIGKIMDTPPNRDRKSKNKGKK